MHSFKSYSLFTVITKYRLYSLCCTTHLWACLIPNSLYLPLPTTILFLPSLPLITGSHYDSLYVWVCFFLKAAFWKLLILHLNWSQISHGGHLSQTKKKVFKGLFGYENAPKKVQGDFIFLTFSPSVHDKRDGFIQAFWIFVICLMKIAVPLFPLNGLEAHTKWVQTH